jgi:hypothetical protein
VQVSFNDALRYCAWAGKHLPRGRVGVRPAWRSEPVGFTMGDEFEPAGEHRMNVWQGRFPNENSRGEGYYGTCPVNAFQPNAYGIHNMTGERLRHIQHDRQLLGVGGRLVPPDIPRTENLRPPPGAAFRRLRDKRSDRRSRSRRSHPAVRPCRRSRRERCRRRSRSAHSMYRGYHATGCSSRLGRSPLASRNARALHGSLRLRRSACWYLFGPTPGVSPSAARTRRR